MITALFSTAFGATAPKQKSKRVVIPEKYAALEETNAIVTPIAPTTIVEPAPVTPRVAQQENKKSAAKAPAPKKPATSPTPIAARAPKPKAQPKLEMEIVAAPAPVATPIPASETLSGDLNESSDPRESFDAVPSDQIPLVIKRLRLIELLISRHARAYDYRALTIRELESRLAQLENKNSRKNQVSTGATAIDEISRVRETEPLPLPPSEMEDHEEDVESDATMVDSL